MPERSEEEQEKGPPRRTSRRRRAGGTEGRVGCIVEWFAVGRRSGSTKEVR